jgi:hypothetical protein
MVNWLNFIIVICIALVLLIPLGIYKIIVYIRDRFLPYRENISFTEKTRIENDITNKHPEWPYEEIRGELYKSPEWVKVKETYNRYSKLRNKISTHCNSELNGKTWIYHILVLIPTIIGTILSAAIICMAIISTPIDMYKYKHWDKKYTHYMSMEHPTYTDCKEAEQANADLEGLIFIEKVYISKCEKINTEELWSRFYSNVKMYTDTLEGGLLRLAESQSELAESQNELAKTLDKFNEINDRPENIKMNN